VAAGLQLILIRSLMNRAEVAAALAVIGRTAAITGLPGATVRQLEATRAWLLILAGQGRPAAELDAMMARFAAAGDQNAQANLLSSVACTAFLAGRLDAALELAEETGTGWVSPAVGFRAYIDAHRGSTGPARNRLESYRHRGLPLHFGHDRPGWAELAVLEAEGQIREAGTLARTLWLAARDHPGRWAADLAIDVTRVALAAMNRRLVGQLAQDVPALCPPEVSLLVRGVLAADPDMIGEAADDLAGAGRLAAEAFAREELACAAATAGDRDRAGAALDAALTSYQRIGAVPDRDRALARTRALGLRRSSREPHRDVGHGWAALTASEVRIAALVRDGLTNREIGSRLFVSPRTVQTHVSHILQKTGLRSRVEIARFAGA
jgi:DNA-binding CsgD family transcriptional regulator